MATATLNKQRVTTGRTNLPAWGCWYADATVDGDAKLSAGDAAELVFADLSLKGTVLSAGLDAAKSRSQVRIVGGKGKWATVLPAKSYANDAGEKVVTILRDAASAAGETFDTSTISSSERVQPGCYSRPKDIASRVLEVLKPAGWYVGEDGVTRIGARAAGKPVGKFTVMSLDAARGTLTLAAESIGKLVPGVVVEGITAVDVQHEINPKGELRTLVWGAQGGTTSRRLQAMRSMLVQLLPNLPYLGTWEYRVVIIEGERVSLQPVRVSTGMPDLQRVPMRPGMAGAKSTLIPGARVLVSFVDADPSRPQVIAFEDSEGGGFKPVLTSIDATMFVKLADGARLMPATGDLAGGIWPILGTTRVMG